MKSIEEIADQYRKVTEQISKQRGDDFNTELSAFADYYERTGKSAHILSSTEQRKLIENWKEDNQ